MQSIAYGTYRDGQILLDTPYPVIDESRVQVIFLNKETNNSILPEKTVAQIQHEAFERFFTTIDAIDDEPITDEDLAMLACNRVSFIRKLDL